MKYVVSVTETGADPVFRGDFQVNASDENTAAEMGLAQAKTAWTPKGAGELMVWEVREEAEVVRT